MKILYILVVLLWYTGLLLALNYRFLLKADKSFIGREAGGSLVCICPYKESSGAYCIALNSGEFGCSCKGVSLHCRSGLTQPGREILNNESRLDLSNSSTKTQDSTQDLLAEEEKERMKWRQPNIYLPLPSLSQSRLDDISHNGKLQCWRETTATPVNERERELSKRGATR